MRGVPAEGGSGKAVGFGARGETSPLYKLGMRSEELGINIDQRKRIVEGMTGTILLIKKHFYYYKYNQ